MNNSRRSIDSQPGLRAGGAGHNANRSFLRGLGLVMTVVGGVFVLVGGVDFFSAFGGHGMPTKFWCFFIGLPLVGIGMNLLRFGYLGAVSRYVAEETVPVVRDSAVDVAEGLRPTIRDIAADLRGTTPLAGGVKVDPAARLEGLSKLRAEGLINESEYAEQRARILSEL